ncbi:MAG: GntR family transcriptional regulator [Beijerinckiaceae bacterium]
MSTAASSGNDAGSPADVFAGLSLTAGEPLVDQIYAALRDAIVRIQFRPGQLLSEKETAEALGASKTPVREAFIRLAGEGLVEVVPKSGTYVSRISVNRFIEARFIRLELEAGAARRAAGRHGDFLSIVRLDACMRQQVEAAEAEDYEAFFNLDEEFHRLVFELAGLSGVWRFLRQSQVDLNRIRHLKRRFGIRRIDRVISQHRAILEALKAGSSDMAEAAMRAHLGSLEGDLEELAANPELLGFIEQLNGNDHERIRRSA